MTSNRVRWLASLFLGVAFTIAGDPAARADAQDNNRVLVEKFTEINNSRQYDLLDDIVHPDFSRHCQATPGVEVRSLEDFKAFVTQDASTFPDSRVEMTHLIAEGDYVAFFGHYTGTQKGAMGPFPATGRKVRVDVSGIFRIADGMIAELWIVWDNLAVLAQLGHSPSKPEDQ